MKKLALVAVLVTLLCGCSAGGHLSIGQNDSSVVQTTTVV